MGGILGSWDWFLVHYVYPTEEQRRSKSLPSPHWVVSEDPLKGIKVFTSVRGFNFNGFPLLL